MPFTAGQGATAQRLGVSSEHIYDVLSDLNGNTRWANDGSELGLMEKYDSLWGWTVEGRHSGRKQEANDGDGQVCDSSTIGSGAVCVHREPA